MRRKLTVFCGNYLKNLEKTGLKPAIEYFKVIFSSFSSTGLLKISVLEESESCFGHNEHLGKDISIKLFLLRGFLYTTYSKN